METKKNKKKLFARLAADFFERKKYSKYSKEEVIQRWSLIKNLPRLDRTRIKRRVDSLSVTYVKRIAKITRKFVFIFSWFRTYDLCTLPSTIF